VKLAEKVALVTGAGSGIGRATTLAFVREGARVVAADLRLDAVRETAEAAEAEVIPASVDVRAEQSVRELFEVADKAFGGRLDVLVNVAGIGSTTTAPDTPLEVWEDVFGVNSRGTFLCCREALARMRPARAGSIVNIASIAGLVGLRNRAAYCGSKGAVIAFTRALALDHVGEGIRVNCICPGTVDSPWVRRLLDESGEDLEALVARQPMGRLAAPEEIALAVVYVASDDAAFMTGSPLIIDGGLTAG
jgi:2-keto-3-deoxy-L-fuconate dehydrogenase